MFRTRCPGHPTEIFRCHVNFFIFDLNISDGRFGYQDYICNDHFVVPKRFGPLTDIIHFYNYILFPFLAPYILTISVTTIFLIQLFFCYRILFQGSNYLTTLSFSSFGSIIQNLSSPWVAIHKLIFEIWLQLQMLK